MPLIMPTVGEIPQLLESQLRALIAAPAGAALLALGLLLLALTALRAAIGVIRFVYSYWLRPGRNLKRYGAWAVVTGATDGIGKAYCKQLARKGALLWLAQSGCLKYSFSEVDAWKLRAAGAAVRSTQRSRGALPLLVQASTWSSSPAPSPSSRTAPRSCGRGTAWRRASAPPTCARPRLTPLPGLEPSWRASRRVAPEQHMPGRQLAHMPTAGWQDQGPAGACEVAPREIIAWHLRKERQGSLCRTHT